MTKKNTKKITFDQDSYDKHMQLAPFNHESSFRKWLEYNHTTQKRFLHYFYHQERINEPKLCFESNQSISFRLKGLIEMLTLRTSNDANKQLKKSPLAYEKHLNKNDFLELLNKDLTKYLNQMMLTINKQSKCPLQKYLAKPFNNHTAFTLHAKEIKASYLRQ